jgi:hypothetical protein
MLSFISYILQDLRINLIFRKPDTRKRNDPQPAASDLSVVILPDVPIDFFPPEFYNALTIRERAQYANTGVAFPPGVCLQPIT